VSTNRTLAWFPESGTDVNVTIVITTPGADYTSLASFGSATDFGLNLVASMDRSFTRGKDRKPEEVCCSLTSRCILDNA
jgi:PsbP